MGQRSYFSHDSNARNSGKLLLVRMSLGAEGYGIFFMILERLREEVDYMSVKDYNMIAFDLRVDASKVKKVVEDFGLFVFTDDGKHFYSESFLRRMKIKDEKSEKRSKAGKKGAEARWDKQNNDSSSLENNQINGNAIAMPYDSIASKEKKSKEKKRKEKEDSQKNKFSDDSLEFKISQYLFEKILANDSKFKKPNLQKWAEHIDKLIRIDKRNDEHELKRVIEFATSDSFWKSNILSTNKLREHYPKLLLQINSNNKQSYYKPDPTVKNELEEKAINELMNKRLRLVK